MICAHCNTVEKQTLFFPEICSILLQNIGTLGVICFFVISGMLFHYQEGKIVSFFTRKVKLICVPWIISASIIYLYVYLRRPPVTIIGWANFVIGNGSYCYYLTILMSMYLVFSLLPFMRTSVAYTTCEILTVISTVWCYKLGELSPYLNIFNWIGYFALGMHISAKKTWFVYYFRKLLKFRRVALILYFIILGVQLYRGSGGGYWHGFNVISCWIGAIALTEIALIIEKNKIPVISKMIQIAGEESFFIYIWHMPIAGIVTKIMCYGFLEHFVLIRPFIILLIVLIIYKFINRISKKLYFDRVVSFIGIR